MNTLVRRIEQAILGRGLVRSRQSLLVGVSGGLDSMVLLQGLHELAAIHRWRLIVVHFNHRLRGRASGADERLVRRTAQRLKLECVVERADVRSLARREGISIEMAARTLRHNFFARLARSRRVRTMALAHHADDQVELFFLRLLRGAGLSGLSGMRWQSPSPIDSALTLVRPLLEFSKAELRGYALAAPISFREDASNAALDIPRNRVRGELLPFLRRRYQPALERTTLRVMEILRADADFISQRAEEWLQQEPKQVPAFEELAAALQRRIVQIQLHRLGYAPDFERIEHLRLKVKESIMLDPRRTASRNSSGRIQLKEAIRLSFNPEELWVDLSKTEGSVRFAHLKIEWKIEPARKVGHSVVQAKVGSELFDAREIGQSMLLRHWRPGDRFQPIGMLNSAKLQNLFTNLKIPKSRRRELVVAATREGNIFWVEGIRISERFKLGRRTRLRLRLSWRGNGQRSALKGKRPAFRGGGTSEE